MIKIVTILGARPQFIKASVLSKLFKSSKDFQETIIHTGQHYDFKMSNIFFQELKIPKPHHNLGVKSNLHGDMTGKMLIKIEKLLLKIKPNFIIVYGDTNSTLAGALAARKLNIPIVAIIDTNSDPDLIDYPIPANDDSMRAVELYVTCIADAILDAKQSQTVAGQKTDSEFVEVIENNKSAQ